MVAVELDVTPLIDVLTNLENAVLFATLSTRISLMLIDFCIYHLPSDALRTSC